MERCGLGTPSTRAGVIELLIARRYVERQGCDLLPTPKGLEVYEAVRDKLIADPEMTARWEKDLQEIERGELDADVFIQKVGNTRGRSWRNSRRSGSNIPDCPDTAVPNAAWRH